MKKRISVSLVLVLLLVLLVNCIAFAADAKLADKYLRQGMQAEKSGQLFQALDAYNAAIKLNANMDEAYFRRGVIRSYHQGKYDEAIVDFSKAIELNAKEADYYNERGICYDKKKMFDEALADYNKAIEIDGKVADYYNGLATTYSKLKDYENAIPNYSKSIELDPKQSYVYYNRGIAYYNTDQYDKAIADYDQAISHIPAKEKDDSYYRHLAQNSYYNKALACEKAERNEEAVTNFRKFLKLAPPAYSTEIDYAKQRIKELS